MNFYSPTFDYNAIAGRSQDPWLESIGQDNSYLTGYGRPMVAPEVGTIESNFGDPNAPYNPYDDIMRANRRRGNDGLQQWALGNDKGTMLGYRDMSGGSVDDLMGLMRMIGAASPQQQWRPVPVPQVQSPFAGGAGLLGPVGSAFGGGLLGRG